MRPILLNSCARAATAAESRFRLDAAIPPARGVRVFALDPAAAEVVARVQRQQWASARFFTATGPDRLRMLGSDPGGHHAGGNGAGVAVEPALDGADVVVLVATDTTGAGTAAAVGAACATRGIMTAGLVLGRDGPQHPDRQAAVAMLRPHARVILATDDDTDVSEVLTALRA